MTGIKNNSKYHMDYLKTLIITSTEVRRHRGNIHTIIVTDESMILKDQTGRFIGNLSMMVEMAQLEAKLGI